MNARDAMTMATNLQDEIREMNQTINNLEDSDGSDKAIYILKKHRDELENKRDDLFRRMIRTEIVENENISF